MQLVSIATLLKKRSFAPEIETNEVNNSERLIEYYMRKAEHLLATNQGKSISFPLMFS